MAKLQNTYWFMNKTIDSFLCLKALNTGLSQTKNYEM
jgi:hypothetical protein